MDPFSEATKLERRIVHRASEQRIPLGGAFELLPLCNMDCRMCFLRLSPKEMEAQGRLRTAEEWLSLAKDARNAGLLFLLLTGGEPFLFPAFPYLYRELPYVLRSKPYTVRINAYFTVLLCPCDMRLSRSNLALRTGFIFLTI